MVTERRKGQGNKGTRVVHDCETKGSIGLLDFPSQTQDGASGWPFNQVNTDAHSKGVGGLTSDMYHPITTDSTRGYALLPADTGG